MKTILVTGGTGYIGSHAVLQLIDKGYNVVIVDDLSNSKEKYIHPKAKFYRGDVLDSEFLHKVFDENTFDGVMHFAGKISVNESTKRPEYYMENNVVGTKNIINQMKHHNVKYFIFSSTAAVYGDPETVPVKEDSKTNPINPYGVSKLEAENLIRNAENEWGMRHTIFRYFNIAGASTKDGLKYDPNVKATHLIPSVNEAALGIREKLLIFGNDYNTKDGTAIRDYVHVEDLARAHVLGLELMFETNESNLICLSSGEGFSVKEVYDEAVKTLNIDIPMEYAPRRDGDPEKLVASNKKAIEILKWNPKLTLSEMIESDFESKKE